MYARITRLHPVSERLREVEVLLDGYLAWLRERPGFLIGLRLAPLVGQNEVVRLTVWVNRSVADATARTDHSIAVRSRLMSMTKDQSIHEEQYGVATMASGLLWDDGSWEEGYVRVDERY